MRYKIKNKDKTDNTHPFIIAEILNTDVFKKDLLLTLKKNPSKIFVPLISLYTGARNDEICQLYIEDIKKFEDTWYFDFNEELDKKLKGGASSRKVPIHYNLLELGFLDYVNFVKKQKYQRIFPELKKGRDGYTTSFTSWFSYFKNSNFPNWGRKKIFYSFRNLFNDTLKHRGIPIHNINDIMGHLSDNIDNDVYGMRTKLQNRKNILWNYLSFEDLDLIHIKNGIKKIFD